MHTRGLFHTRRHRPTHVSCLARHRRLLLLRFITTYILAISTISSFRARNKGNTDQAQASFLHLSIMDRSNIGSLGLVAVVAVVSTSIILVSCHLRRRLQDDTKLNKIAEQQRQSKTTMKEVGFMDDVAEDLSSDEEECPRRLGKTAIGVPIQPSLRRVPRFNNLAFEFN
ncbi:hypothetical protein VPH35_087826 [Triticum aestivum]